MTRGRKIYLSSVEEDKIRTSLTQYIDIFGNIGTASITNTYIPKKKSIMLLCGHENGQGWAVRTSITQTGGFHMRTKIDFGVSARGKPSRIRTRKAHVVRRRHNLGFHPISFGHVGCVWHHVNKRDVVAVPQLIHTNVHHSLIDGSALKIEGVIG